MTLWSLPGCPQIWGRFREKMGFLPQHIEATKEIPRELVILYPELTCYNHINSLAEIFVSKNWEFPQNGDDRLRRERLFPECEPRGAELVNSAQKIKCQPHFLCCYAPRCISDLHNSRPPQMRPRPPAPISARDRPGRDKRGVPYAMLLNVRKTNAAGSG